jgi:polysaccharide biosynthesis transport protein
MSDHLPFESQPQAQDSQVAAGDRSPGVVTPFPGSKTTNGATPERPPDTAYGYGPADGVLGAGGQLSDYVRLVYKRRNTGFLAFALVAALVLGYTFTATPIFEARTQLLLEVDNPNVVSFKEVVEQGQANTDYYQTQYRILQSRSLVRRTLEREQLWDHPQFKPAAPSAVVQALGGAAAWVGGLVRGGEQEEPAGDETEAQSLAIDRFLKGLSVSPIRNSRLVDVKFRSPDPKLSARVANGVAAAFIDQNTELKFNVSKEASDWLGGQLAEQRTKVEASEQALQRYREQTDSVALEDRQNIVVQKLADVNAAVTKVKTERIQKEALYNQIKAVGANDAELDTLPSILSNGFIQQLKAEIADQQRQYAQARGRFGPKHPDMVKLQSSVQTSEQKLRGEIEKIVQALQNDYQTALAQERSLVAALEAQKREALSLNRKGIDYGVLLRDAESNRQIYESLLQRTKEAGISRDLRTANVRIIDRAEVPRRQASPRTGLNLFLALFVGAIVGLGSTFVFEYIDGRIKNPEEMRALGLAFLGMVPVVPTTQGQEERPLLLSRGMPPAFSEAFRAIRTNVLFSSAEEGLRTVVVTSPRPGEGKSVVASNLAEALAQTGQRVLLVDTDMRRPRVHKTFRVPREPGLSNLLVGGAQPRDCVHAGPVKGLWIMTAGTLPPNPAELLGSRRFKSFLGTLPKHFDWVVFDAPPVMAVTDASITAHLASGVVFVIGAESTAYTAAQAALAQLKAARANLIGGVLNRVDVKGHAYYYADYYQEDYTAYHRSAASR